MSIHTPGNSTVHQDQETFRSRLIDNQAEILRSIPRNDDKEVIEGVGVDEEIEEIDFMIQKCQQKIRNYTITKELNDDTEESLCQVAAGIESTEEELSEELTAVRKRLNEAKQTLDYVLKTYYPGYHEEMRTILMELERASAAELEEDRYVKLSDDCSTVPVLILQKAFCIVQHPTKLDCFKLAPLR